MPLFGISVNVKSSTPVSQKVSLLSCRRWHSASGRYDIRSRQDAIQDLDIINSGIRHHNVEIILPISSFPRPVGDLSQAG